MFTTLKRWADVLTVKTRDLFNSSKSEIYVEDLRKVVTHKNGKKCKFPNKNYDKIVKFGKIVDRGGSKRLCYSETENANEKKNEKKKLPEFDLTLVEKDGKPYVTDDNKSYYTIDFLVKGEKRKNDNYTAYYEPFGFSQIDLEKHIPVLEVDNASGKLTNSSILKKEIKKNGKVKEDDDPEGRNGELLYTSEWKKLNPDFFEIRDHNGNLELDKSFFVSVPLAFATYSASVFAGWVTSPFMKVGEWFISKQHPIAKAVGYSLYIPPAAVKNVVNIASTMLRFLILPFVADKEEYGDSYLTMWKHQLKESWQELKDDFSVIKNGKREKRVEIDYPKFKAGGTWKELNAIKTVNEKKLEEYEQDPEEYKKKYNDIQQSNELVSPARSKSSKPVNQLTENPVTSTVVEGETMCANPPTPPVEAGQNTSSPTPELGDSNHPTPAPSQVGGGQDTSSKRESHLGRQQSRRNSQSSITTPPRN